MMSFHKVAPNVWIFARTISTYYGFGMMVATGELFFLSLWMELANINVKCQVTTMFKELKKKKSYLLRRILNRRKKTQFASMTEILPPLRSPLLCRLFSTHHSPGLFFSQPPPHRPPLHTPTKPRTIPSSTAPRLPNCHRYFNDFTSQW